MANRKSIDCRDYPSEKNCSLKISGTKEEVLDAAVQHAVSAHRHENSPELRDQIMVSDRDRAYIEARAKGIDLEATMRSPFRQMPSACSNWWHSTVSSVPRAWSGCRSRSRCAPTPRPSPSCGRGTERWRASRSSSAGARRGRRRSGARSSRACAAAPSRSVCRWLDAGSCRSRRCGR